MVVGARQSFQFFRKNNWFLESNRALSKLLYGILHNLIGITRFFISNNSVSNARLNLTKNQAKVKQHPEA